MPMKTLENEGIEREANERTGTGRIREKPMKALEEEELENVQ